MNGNEIATLLHLYRSDSPQTTTDIAKAVFSPSDTDAMRNADGKIRHYLTEKYDHLLTADTSGRATTYTLKDEVFHYGLGKIDVATLYDDEVTLGLGETMVFESADGGWTVVDVEDGLMKTRSENPL